MNGLSSDERVTGSAYIAVRFRDRRTTGRKEDPVDKSDGRKIGYSLREMSEHEEAELVAALRRRGVPFSIEDDWLDVSETHEEELDEIVTRLTGEPPDPTRDEPEGVNGEELPMPTPQPRPMPVAVAQPAAVGGFETW